MRGQNAILARDSPAHLDVMAANGAVSAYPVGMRAILVLAFSTLLLASLLGLAHPDRSANLSHFEDDHPAALLQDALCGEGSGHAACQIVAAASPGVHVVMAFAGTSLFGIVPVKAAGRTFPPGTPPPRHSS